MYVHWIWTRALSCKVTRYLPVKIQIKETKNVS
jgi:hypothetical protein